MENVSKPQGKYFDWKHIRLLNIASWAKNAAMVVPVIYIILAVMQIPQFQNSAIYKASINDSSLNSLIFFLSQNPIELAKLGMSMIVTMFEGVVYYLVLRGIFLGLTMIVETDINYRDQQEEGAQ